MAHLNLLPHRDPCEAEHEAEDPLTVEFHLPGWHERNALRRGCDHLD